MGNLGGASHREGHHPDNSVVPAGGVSLVVGPVYAGCSGLNSASALAELKDKSKHTILVR